MKVNLEESLGKEWYDILKDEFNQPYMKTLKSLIANEKLTNTVYPVSKDVFNAYRSTGYSEVKVCIIGQDPYIRKNQAHGLSFSVENNAYTPSLKQIEKAIRSQYDKGDNYIWSNNLSRWTQQGVFLLNVVLTVNEGKSNSHKGFGWEQFTARTIEELDKKKTIFLLWGKEALQLSKYINNSTIISCEHPVAASYQGRMWNNNDCFRKTDELLGNIINW